MVSEGPVRATTTATMPSETTATQLYIRPLLLLHMCPLLPARLQETSLRDIRTEGEEEAGRSVEKRWSAYLIIPFPPFRARPSNWTVEEPEFSPHLRQQQQQLYRYLNWGGEFEGWSKSRLSNGRLCANLIISFPPFRATPRKSPVEEPAEHTSHLRQTLCPCGLFNPVQYRCWCLKQIQIKVSNNARLI